MKGQFNNEKKEEYTVDFNKLKEQNNETIAWIKVNNILTLSTCANNNKYRVVLHSVRIK